METFIIHSTAHFVFGVDFLVLEVDSLVVVPRT